MKPLELTESQSRVFLDDESKAVAFVTGFGGGKSLLLCAKMVDMKLKYPKADLCYLFPVHAMFRDILYPTLAELLDGTDIRYRINQTNGEIFFENAGRVILKSMDNPETIIGFNVLAVFFDELDTLPTEKARQVWIKGIARARKKVQKLDWHGKDPRYSDGTPVFDSDGDPVSATNQLIVGTTPEGYRFVYDRFKKKKPRNYTLIQASGRENTYLPKDYYSDLEEIYSKELVNAYIDGEFVNLQSGTVYKEYDRHYCDSDAIYRDGETLHISIDFNVRNVNGVVYVVRDPLMTDLPGYPYNTKPTLHAVHHFHSIADTPELIEVIQNRFPRSPVFCYPDATGKNVSSKGITLSDTSLLKKAGFHVRAPGRNPRILDRVQSANSAFKTQLVRINSHLCPLVTEALEQQVYNQVTELPDKKASTAIDDINDAATYVIHYLYPILLREARAKHLKGF